MFRYFIRADGDICNRILEPRISQISISATPTIYAIRTTQYEIGRKKAEPIRPGLLNRRYIRFKYGLPFLLLLSPDPNSSFGLFRDEPDVLLTLTIFKLQRRLLGKVLQH